MHSHHHPPPPYPHHPIAGLPPQPGYFPYQQHPGMHAPHYQPLSKIQQLISDRVDRQASSHQAGPAGPGQSVAFSTLSNDVIPDREFVKETEKYQPKVRTVNSIVQINTELIERYMQ
jgi:hypothetical protein